MLILSFFSPPLVADEPLGRGGAPLAHSDHSPVWRGGEPADYLAVLSLPWLLAGLFVSFAVAVLASASSSVTSAVIGASVGYMLLAILVFQ